MTSILGIDPGEKRVGVAVADLDTRIITPLVVLKNNRTFISELKKLYDEYNFNTVVVGIPLTSSGLEGKQAQKALALAKKIKLQLPVAIKFQDERHTSRLALTKLQITGHDKSKVDALAAVLILESWLARSKS
ncbi:Holliday junction resolvase RuvX [candidate division Kazan bacterium]|uniref:Putative pre-16S rRNA nuclease n=1 Tax=candidate division Kazan bacterium TaxID=2202143 RepID=A0A420ZDJ3_UNCK3|nr:MAG: Holliday junction resolvase RuvX [candidate division Kazan bacterium]